ncbi:hypothetical protein TELCIR_12187, partial [Teladorsagia circumcincta]
RDVFAAVVDVLPREKAVHLMLEWKTNNRNYENELEMAVAEPQLHTAIRFLLEQTGISIEQHERLPWRKRTNANEDCETDAKQRRPKASAEENWSRVLKFREATNSRQPKIGEKSESSSVNVVIKIDSTAPLHGNIYAVIGAIHASFEEWSLDCGLFHLKSQIVYYLHAATSALGLKAYSSHYKTEFVGCSDCIYEVQRTDGLVLGVGLGTGRLALMTDVHRLLGRNWERRLRLRPDQVDKVAEIMFSNSRTPAQKSVALITEFGFTRWTIEQLPPSIGLLLGSIIMGQHTSTELFQFKSPQTVTSFPQPEEMSQIARIRWPRDVRRDNVRAMLDSTKPVLIATQHLDAGTDGEIREAQEQFLNATWTRYLAQAFGRAFFTFRTVLPNPAEALYVPELCLSARIYPSNLTYDLTLTEPLRHLREWGEFYNGVAAGLSVVGADVARVDHEWLTLCHTNDKISPPTAAGLLYAFGLNGHLPNFNMFHVHEVLASLDKFPSIALLLGMAMSKIGTADRQIYTVERPSLRELSIVTKDMSNTITCVITLLPPINRHNKTMKAVV